MNRVIQIIIWFAAASSLQASGAEPAAGRSAAAVNPEAAVIVTQPYSQTVYPGGTALFSVAAVGALPFRYQWAKDGVAIPGATAVSCSIPDLTFAAAGNYSVTVSNAYGSATSSAATLTVARTAYLANLSVRAALPDDGGLTVGLVGGEGFPPVLVRAAGPALQGLGVTGAMPDPVLTLYHGSTQIAQNDDWNASLSVAFRTIGAFPFPAGSKDSALTTTVAGPTTAYVTGNGGGGVVLIEAYSFNPAPGTRLINLSARNRVGTGSDALIAGFYIGGTGAMKVLVRAVGPGLAQFGFTGTVDDPKLELYDAKGSKVAENDNWDATLAPTFAAAGAFALPPQSKDAAAVYLLSANQTYTVQVSDLKGDGGAAMVEVYEVP